MPYKDYKRFVEYAGRYKEKFIENWKFVDEIDFKPYLINYRDREETYVGDFYKQVEEDLIKNGLKVPENYEDFAFNWISEEELAKYLASRYPELISNIDIITTPDWRHMTFCYFIWK